MACIPIDSLVWAIRQVCQSLTLAIRSRLRSDLANAKTELANAHVAQPSHCGSSRNIGLINMVCVHWRAVQYGKPRSGHEGIRSGVCVGQLKTRRPRPVLCAKAYSIFKNALRTHTKNEPA